MEPTCYPLLFTPVLKDYIWGGRNLEKLARALPPTGVIAESWEIAAHADGDTPVENGRFAGQPLTAVHAQLGLDLIGQRNAWAQARAKFPLLIKLLDANQPLSVQVHPDDAYAQTHEGQELGKTEMWVVLHATPDAEIILGLTAGTTPEAFRMALENGRPEPHLHHIPLKTGDHVCVPAGSLHAIMGGLLIAEIQQNSNTTYRVYDWNRCGTDGRLRPLHIAKALDVINFAQIAPQPCPPLPLDNLTDGRRWELCRNPYFVVERVELPTGGTIHGRTTGATCEIWGVLEGDVTVNDWPLTAVRFTLLPAALGDYTITTPTPAHLLRCYTPPHS